MLFLVLANAFWAGNYLLGEAAADAVDPLSLTLLRWSIAAVPLLVIAQLLEKPDWRSLLRRWRLLVLMAALGMVAYNLALYQALHHTTAVSASLISAANPVVIAVAAALLLREPIGRRGLVGLALGLVGVLLVVSKGHLERVLALQVNAGDLLMLASVVAWTAYTLLARRLRGVPPIAATGAQAVLAALGLLPVAAVSGIQVPSDPGSILALGFIALFAGVGSYLLWNLAVESVPAALAGVSLNLIAVFTVLITLALGRPVGGAELAGGALVLVGVGVMSSRPRRGRAVAD